MKIQINPLLSAILLAVFAVSAQAGNARFFERVNTWPIMDPNLGEARHQLTPWFIDCQDRISHAGTTHSADVFRDRTVICTFQLNANGTVADLKIAKTSGCSQTDAAALSLVRKAQPYSQAPNHMAYERRISWRYRTFTGEWMHIGQTTRMSFHPPVVTSL